MSLLQKKNMQLQLQKIKELMEKINDALVKLEESGKLNEIMLKYIPAE